MWLLQHYGNGIILLIFVVMQNVRHREALEDRENITPQYGHFALVMMVIVFDNVENP